MFNIHRYVWHTVHPIAIQLKQDMVMFDMWTTHRVLFYMKLPINVVNDLRRTINPEL